MSTSIPGAFTGTSIIRSGFLRTTILAPSDGPKARISSTTSDENKTGCPRRLSKVGRTIRFGARFMIIDSIVDRKSTRLNSSHLGISYAVFWLKKKNGAVVHGRRPGALAEERGSARSRGVTAAFRQGGDLAGGDVAAAARQLPSVLAHAGTWPT